MPSHSRPKATPKFNIWLQLAGDFMGTVLSFHFLGN